MSGPARRGDRWSGGTEVRYPQKTPQICVDNNNNNRELCAGRGGTQLFVWVSLSLTFSHFQTQTEDKGCVLQENKSNKMSTFRDRKTQLENMSKFTVNC